MEQVFGPIRASSDGAGHDRRSSPMQFSWPRILAFVLAISVHLLAIGWLARSDTSPFARFFAARSTPNDMVVDVAVTAPRPRQVIGKTSALPAAPHNMSLDAARRQPTSAASAIATPVLAPSADEPAGILPESGADAAGHAAAAGDGDGEHGSGAQGTGGQAGDGDGLTIEKLRPIHAPAPEYPQHALDNSEQGIVILLVRVGVNGAPLSARIVKSSGFDELDQITLKKVLAEWRFVAATRNGVKVEALTLARQAFVLH